MNFVAPQGASAGVHKAGVREAAAKALVSCLNPGDRRIRIMIPQEMKPGQNVHYVPQVGQPENGIVKSFNAHRALVVYKCAGNWGRYMDYTAASTELEDLREGWV